MLKSRLEAGYQLAQKLKEEGIGEKGTIVCSLPRGGTIVGAAVASLLGKTALPHTVVITRKLPAPGNPELAIGAVGAHRQSLVVNKPLLRSLNITPSYLAKVIRQAQKEIARRRKLYLGKKQMPNLTNKTVILVDDGAATGATMLAAIREVRLTKPKKIIVALPVAPPDTVARLQKEADAVVTLLTPRLFFSVSQFYQSFPQVSDEEVIRALHQNA